MDKPIVLSEEEVKTSLQRLPGWEYKDGKLTKEFSFLDFAGSLTFINRMLAYFQEMDHHPDIHIYYNKIQFELVRYDSGSKVTDRDVQVAKKIEETYASENKL